MSDRVSRLPRPPMTTQSVRAAGLDKFYTIPAVADTCIGITGAFYPWLDWDLVVEPSAGNGSFLLRIPTNKRIGIDISPDCPGCVTHDFLTWRPPTAAKILVIGNPPFGKGSSLAIKFFNHAAKWASVIAFIIPKSFRRVSVQNRLSSDFHLLWDDDIPTDPCSFTPPMMVKCCFQIWTRRDVKRELVEMSTTHADWDFLPFGSLDADGQPTPPEGADFAIRAYGGQCGAIVKGVSLATLRPKSWHWIRAKTLPADILIGRFTALDYSISKETARQNSIGRSDLVRLYEEAHE